MKKHLTKFMAGALIAGMMGIGGIRDNVKTASIDIDPPTPYVQVAGIDIDPPTPYFIDPPTPYSSSLVADHIDPPTPYIIVRG